MYWTMLKIIRLFGGSPKSKLDWIYSFVVLFICALALCYYWPYFYLKDVYGFEKLGVMESIHWGSLYIGISCITAFMIIYRAEYIEIDKMVTSGFFNYGEDFTDEQLQIRQNANNFIVKIIKIYYATIFAGTFVTFLKQPLFTGKSNEYNVLYTGYIPFEISNAFIYSLVLFMNVIHAIHSGGAAFLITASFFASCFHLSAQIEILNLAIKKAVEEKDEVRSIAMLKKCILHHTIIKRFYNLTSKYFGMTVGIVPVFTVFMMCTFLYEITDPNTSTLVRVGTFFLVFMPELCFIEFTCVCGQQLTDMSDNITYNIYNTPWYERTVKVRKHLWTIMLACHEPMIIKGFDILPFSIEGLKEVFKTGYTFFNALNAARTM